MKAREIAERYGVSIATAKRYKREGAPVENAAGMREFMGQKRSRIFCGRGGRATGPRRLPPATSIPVPREEVIVPEVVDTLLTDADAANTDPEAGTLERLQAAEKFAYQRYMQTGSAQFAQIWLLTSDQLRKTKDSLAKNPAEFTAGETRYVQQCFEIMNALVFNICEASPKVQAKIKDQLERAFRHTLGELADKLRGTSLATWLPAEMR